MLHKDASPTYKKFVKRGLIGFFVLEAAAFAGSYYCWHKLNTDFGFRRYLRDNHPAILETFYQTGELLDSNSRIREIDAAYWRAEEN